MLSIASASRRLVPWAVGYPLHLLRAVMTQAILPTPTEASTRMQPEICSLPAKSSLKTTNRSKILPGRASDPVKKRSPARWAHGTNRMCSSINATATFRICLHLKILAPQAWLPYPSQLSKTPRRCSKPTRKRKEKSWKWKTSISSLSKSSSRSNKRTSSWKRSFLRLTSDLHESRSNWNKIS